MKLQLAESWRLAFLWATLCGAAVMPHNETSKECRCVPGDACWPSVSEWDAFNKTVGGKLVASVPLASVCHDSAFAPYNEAKCSDLRSNWFSPETHLGSSSSIMAPFFTNNSCNPFLQPNSPCSLGNFVSYAVNATCTADYQAAIKFVRHHNIRLVIHNTGHDYNGKSTGAGGLAIWTYYMKDMEIVDYKSPSYTGKALKAGAGVSSLESYQFSNKHGYANAGGDCPTVGVTGGWSQGGGGHGPAVSKFGAGADQTLEWEVVTGTDEVLIANEQQNQDLFWALSGGGGGTYGVVSSLTFKVYPDLRSSAANLTFAYNANKSDAFWDAIETYQASIPDITSSGCFAISPISQKGFSLEPMNCPGLSRNETEALLHPVISKLKQHHIPYNLSVTEFPDFLSSYTNYNLAAPKNVSDSQLGSRLIPRKLLDQNNANITQIFRDVHNMNATSIIIAVNISQSAAAMDKSHHTSVDPERREAAFLAIFNTEYSQTDYSVNVARANEMTNVIVPRMTKLLEATNNTVRSYLNECDFQEPNFQEVLYGVNYEPLLRIKDKYDPDQIFYAVTAVGSERWYEDRSHGGRLCPVGK